MTTAAAAAASPAAARLASATGYAWTVVPDWHAAPRWCTSNLSALGAYARDPAAYPGAVLAWCDAWVVVRDRYPKALVHVLVVPRAANTALCGVAGAAALRPGHVPALRDMHSVALAVWAEVSQWWGAAHPTFPMARFPAPRVGFHAVPSLTPLHCHVMSADLHSDCMKTKRHFLSFTAPAFFLPLAAVIATLEDDLVGADGLAIAEHVAARALTGVLACHRCGAVTRNMPALKTHLAACFQLTAVPPASASDGGGDEVE